VVLRDTYEGVLEFKGFCEMGERWRTRAVRDYETENILNDALLGECSVDFNTNQNHIFARAASMELTSCDFFWDVGET